MPDWYELLSELQTKPSPQDELRHRTILNLHNLTHRNVIVYYSGWLQKPNSPISNLSISDADMNGFMTVIHGMDKTLGLDLLLHTPGGDMAATESLINYLSSIFDNIRAIIPQMAMSGGSMIACCCDEIVMGEHSSAGPFDPQIDGVPAQAITEDFLRACTDMANSHDAAYVWQPILNKYKLGFFSRCENAIKMAEEVVRKGLMERMLKDDSQKDAKINNILKTLGRNAATKMHARHIHKEKLKELGLKIVDLEKYNDLQDAVLSVHHACMLTFDQSPAVKIIQGHNKKAYVNVVNISNNN